MDLNGEKYIGGDTNNINTSAGNMNLHDSFKNKMVLNMNFFSFFVLVIIMVQNILKWICMLKWMKIWNRL